MKKIQLRSVLLFGAIAFAVAMLVLVIFSNAVGHPTGAEVKLNGLVFGAKEIKVNGDVFSIEDIFGLKTTGLNVVPFIGFLVAALALVALIVVNLLVKDAKLKKLLSLVMGILILAGAITQFFALTLLPNATLAEMVKQAKAEGHVPTAEEKENALKSLKQMYFEMWELKAGVLEILSGVFGCLAGALAAVAALLPAKK